MSFNFKELFKSEKQVIDREPIYEKAVTKGKTVNEIIDEIHENFYTEVDRLLASAKISNSLETNKQALIDKHNALISLGFINSKEVKEAEAELKRISHLRQENLSKERIVGAINYFSFKYPNYKFITEDSVKKICAKYNLVYGTIDKYIGEVPDKNMKHIQEFKISEDDEIHFSKEVFHEFSGSRLVGDIKYFSTKMISEKLEKKRKYNEDNPENWIHDIITPINMYYSENKGKCQLEIAAPLKDFDMEKHEIKDFKISKIEIHDPVVLHPVFFEGEKHYLIVTAWGQEASDELVVNQKFN